jgi:hypothetical protein
VLRRVVCHLSLLTWRRLDRRRLQQRNNSPDLDRVHSALADFAIVGGVEDEADMVFHCTRAPLQAVCEALPDWQPLLVEGSVHALVSKPPQLVAAFLQID